MIQSFKNLAQAKKSNVLEKHQQAIIKIENSTATGIFLKWLITNWFTVLLVLVSSLIVISNYIKTEEWQSLLWKEEINQLETSLKESEAKNKELKDKINNLTNQAKKDQEDTAKLREDLVKLNFSELQTKLIEYTERLKDRRKK